MFRVFSRKKPDQLRSKKYIAILSVVVIAVVFAVTVLDPYIMAEREFGETCEIYSNNKQSLDFCKSFCLGPCDNKDNSNASIKDCFYMGDMESCMETCRSNSRVRCVMDMWASEHGFAYKE